MKTLVIFDIDGTLLFSNKIDSEIFGSTFLDRYGKAFPSIEWTYFPHVTDHTIFGYGYKELFAEFPSSEEMSAFCAAFVKNIEEARVHRPQEFQPVPGVKSLVQRLIETDAYEIAVATGGWGAPARVKLGHVGLLTTELVIAAADGNPTREDIIQQAIRECKQKDYNWDRMVYVGDASWDVKTCRNMNLPFIGIRRAGDHDKLLDLGASHVFSDYHEELSFLKAIEGAKVPFLKA